MVEANAQPRLAKGKDSAADNEHQTSAVKIGEQAAADEKCCIDEIVGVNDPLQFSDGGLEVDPYWLNRQIDDRCIDLRHDHAKAQNGESGGPQLRVSPGVLFD